MKQTPNLKTTAFNVTELREINPVYLTCLVVGVIADRWNNYACILSHSTSDMTAPLWTKNVVSQMILGVSKNHGLHIMLLFSCQLLTEQVPPTL